MSNVLLGYYNEFSYNIQDHQGTELYTGGNSPWDSTSVVDLDVAVPLDSMKTNCETTLAELCQEQSATNGGVEYSESD